jgi:hypothetical protein
LGSSRYVLVGRDLEKPPSSSFSIYKHNAQNGHFWRIWPSIRFAEEEEASCCDLDFACGSRHSHRSGRNFVFAGKLGQGTEHRSRPAAAFDLDNYNWTAACSRRGG